MRTMGAWAALLILPLSLRAQTPRAVPVCQAERQGEALTTRIEFPSGYSVEAPWRIIEFVNTGRATTVRAVLDRIVEAGPSATANRTTPLPAAIALTFRGNSLNELLHEAAQLWCATVSHARDPYESGGPAGNNTLARHLLM